MDQLVHLLAQRVVLLRKAFCEMLLVYDLLRGLITVECETATGALHDDRRAQTAQHTGLVVF